MPYKILSDEERGRIVGMREWSEEVRYCICIECSMVKCFYYLDKLEGPGECKIFEIPMW
jgi:hypothetical protein